MGTPRTEPVEVELLEEAFAALGDRHDALTARVTARLAHALLFSDDRARRMQLADDAVALARETSDTGALVSALYVWNIVHITSANFTLRLEHADELVALGRSSGQEDIEAWALHCHAHHMAEGGDLAGFDADVAAGDVLARRAQSATWQWAVLVHRAMRATMQGRFDDAEQLGNDAFELGARSQPGVATATFGAHLMALRTWQGRLDELLPMITVAAGQYPELPALWASVPFAHAELGQIRGGCRGTRTRAHQSSARRGSRRPVVDRRACHAGARRRAHRRRHAPRDACISSSSHSASGTSSDPLPTATSGRRRCTSGCARRPRERYQKHASSSSAALRQAKAVGARPIVAWTKGELADALDRRGGDGQHVADLRAEAAAELLELGMPRHLARLTPSEHPARSSNVFSRTGEDWSVTYEGRTVSLRHTKGLADLHRLLSAPNVELHVLELAQEAEGEGVELSGRQPVLDERAKAEYRRRLLALEADIEDARTCADLGRAERAELEHDLIVSELAAALGFGGRDRGMTDEAERARQAVRARIRYALDRIEVVHPELSRHLERAVVTGTFCSYRPEQETAWLTS